MSARERLKAHLDAGNVVGGSSLLRDAWVEAEARVAVLEAQVGKVRALAEYYDGMGAWKIEPDGVAAKLRAVLDEAAATTPELLAAYGIDADDHARRMAGEGSAVPVSSAALVADLQALDQESRPHYYLTGDLSDDEEGREVVGHQGECVDINDVRAVVAKHTTGGDHA